MWEVLSRSFLANVLRSVGNDAAMLAVSEGVGTVLIASLMWLP